jgi:deoxyribonuclease-4
VKNIGIHLRIKNSYVDLLKEAENLGLKTCQFFFLNQETNKHVKITDEEREKYLDLRKNFLTIYGHGSYWINLASGNQISSDASKRTLQKELAIAKKLGIEKMILHAGTAKGFEKKENGIESAAKMLTEALEEEKKINFLIENTAHGNKAVCSNLEDFAKLQKLIKKNDRVKFCLDTSHAWAYGYDVSKTEEFIEILDKTMGLKNIKLIHLNDSKKKCGSRIDQHEVPGKGMIGKKALQNLINHPELNKIPIIIEPPLISLEQTKEMLENAQSL